MNLIDEFLERRGSTLAKSLSMRMTDAERSMIGEFAKDHGHRSLGSAARKLIRIGYACVVLGWSWSDMDETPGGRP